MIRMHFWMSIQVIYDVIRKKILFFPLIGKWLNIFLWLDHTPNRWSII
jgi:hypothetical protein